MEKTSNAAMYAGSAGAVFLTWLDNHAAAIGALVAIAGYLTSIYFQWRRDRREEKQAAEDAEPNLD